MEKNHLPAVQKMIDILLMDDRRYFSFLDVGCGNGYVVRKISELKQCVISVGMDGAEGMIKKAKKMDPNGNYYCSNIVDWIPKLKFDYIHSMEVMYYLENPEKTIKSIVNNWLDTNGVMIMGVDYYLENEKSHSWPKDLNVPMKLLSISQWSDILKKSGLNKVNYLQANKGVNFSGTLILYGRK